MGRLAVNLFHEEYPMLLFIHVLLVAHALTRFGSRLRRSGVATATVLIATATVWALTNLRFVFQDTPIYRTYAWLRVKSRSDMNRKQRFPLKAHKNKDRK